MQTLEQLQSGSLKGLKHIKISESLNHFPLEILDLADSLEILDLSNNKLSALPDSFSCLHQLKIAFFSDNLFEELPEVLGQCPSLEMIGFKSNQIKTISALSLPKQLRWLILTNNQIKQIPAAIGACYRLQKLALAGNLLEELPVELAQCKNLELIRISANRLHTFPEFLLHMPRLAWIAYAGNPIDFPVQIPANLRTFDMNDIQLGKVLGQGASGIIYKSKLKQEEEELAVKIFKGQVTSDGFPETEMNICLLLGQVPNLVEVKGRIINHPDGKEGLLMGLIPGNYKNLGNPPSFESCTRDVFDVYTNFSLHQIHTILLGIARVARHFHKLGISHGDLYAHNILYNEQAEHLLGDFGAGTFYDTQSPLAELIEKVEVRAFAFLIDDFLQNTNEPPSVLSPYYELYDQCSQERVEQRPNFKWIVEFLEQLKTV
ncbi:MAG: leucine-rich repeat-containing protein kinase family protein [Bacteroidia bacterium]